MILYPVDKPKLRWYIHLPDEMIPLRHSSAAPLRVVTRYLTFIGHGSHENMEGNIERFVIQRDLINVGL